LAVLVAVLAGCNADRARNPDAAAIWGPLDCQRQGAWRPDWWKKPLVPRSYKWFSSGGPADQPYRRLTVFDGQGDRGERCELGFSDWGNHWRTNGSFQVYHEGDHRLTGFWLRFPDNFPINTRAWQLVSEMRQSDPAMSAGGPPVLGVYQNRGRFHLLHYGRGSNPLWTSGPIRRNTWTPVVEDVVYSRDPAKGSIRLNTDLNADHDVSDPGEASPLIHTTTLKGETRSGGPIPRGASIPSVLRVGPFHDRAIPCPDGCSLDVGPVGVTDPGNPSPDPGPCATGSSGSSSESGGCPIPTVWRRSASFESSPTAGTDGWRTFPPYTITRTNEVGGADGSYAERIDTLGANAKRFDPGACSCPRMKFEDGHAYGPGDEVWMSGSWLIPNPQRLKNSRLMNLAHWTATGVQTNSLLGLFVDASGRLEVLARNRLPTNRTQSVLMSPRPTPVNRWFRVDIHVTDRRPCISTRRG
jgi:hypothetical protein